MFPENSISMENRWDDKYDGRAAKPVDKKTWGIYIAAWQKYDSDFLEQKYDSTLLNMVSINTW